MFITYVYYSINLKNIHVSLVKYFLFVILFAFSSLFISYWIMPKIPLLY